MGRAAPRRLCACGHPRYCHHVTPKAHRFTFCTVWDPAECGCTQYTAGPPDAAAPGGPATTDPADNKETSNAR